MAVYRHDEPFTLEAGGVLPQLEITYDTYGSLNGDRNNVVWICHALTASSKAADWWPPLVGPGEVWDTDKYFVVCANMLGSCYGTTGPLSTDPQSGRPYFSLFPAVSIRDMVRAHALLAAHLGISSIAVLAGGSMGGYQALEWCVIAPQFIRRLFVIATSAQESPWGKAIHAAQRLAIEADPTWKDFSADAGAAGIRAARGIGMLTYRTYEAFAASQSDPDANKLDGFKAASYINYQGTKLAQRFHAFSYWLLTKAMDTHHLGRGRNASTESVLRTIRQQALVMGIRSDLLCPLSEQELLAACIPASHFVPIDSLYGHDGFLMETASITLHAGQWMREMEEANT
jgi:homoserine O-acetyltransferase